MIAAMIQRRASHAGDYQQQQTMSDPGKRASVSTLGSSNMSNYGVLSHQPPLPQSANSMQNQQVRMRTSAFSVF